jgi:hypothetical protein
LLKHINVFDTTFFELTLQVAKLGIAYRTSAGAVSIVMTLSRFISQAVFIGDLPTDVAKKFAFIFAFTHGR